MARPKLRISAKLKDRVYELRAKGFTEEQIAVACKISYSSFRKYKKQFSSALKKGTDDFYQESTPKVENALLKRCLGYTYYENKIVGIKVDGKFHTKERSRTLKQVAPDPVSIMFWLANRSKVKWQNPQRVIIPSGDGEKEIPIVSNIKPMKREKTK